MLCHSDAHRGNLLVTATGPVWVDFEYAGLGPAALDLAFTLGDIVRYTATDVQATTTEFLDGYQDHGGVADLGAVSALLRVRDICGVADCIPLAKLDPDPWAAELARCHATYLEPFRTSTWLSGGPV